MSAKWRRSLAWDDRHFPAWAGPFKFVLRALSSIWLAVTLLIFVALYGVLASVPIGLLALIPTKLFYGLTWLTAVVLVGSAVILPARAMLARRVGRGGMFALWMIGVCVAVAAGTLAWYRSVWPGLHFDPLGNNGAGSGVRFFSDFVEAYSAVTLRRLPAFEMSELEFYSWWPLRVVLVLFVINMIVATARRIEFNFKNIGVLTVHTGIVLIALGSVYYNGLKLEGDTILLAPEPSAGAITPTSAPGNDGPRSGPLQNAFYSNTRVSLYVEQMEAWGSNGLEQRVMSGVPRYNEYNLAAGISADGENSAMRLAGRPVPWAEPARNVRTLDVRVPGPPAGRTPRVDPDIEFRVVGYAPYAEPAEDWQKGDVSEFRTIRTGDRLNPLRMLYLHSALPDAETGKVSDRPVFAFTMLPELPQHRVAENGVLGIEYAPDQREGSIGGMTEARWADLSASLPAGTRHALVIEVPGILVAGKPLRTIAPVEQGSVVDVGVSGYRVSVQELLPEPPFPIVTEGFKGASSSVAVVRVERPVARVGDAREAYTRYIYHRFPQIDQDILDTPKADGRPNRRDADPALRITYLDVTRLQVYFNERTDGSVRAIVRQPGGALRVVERVPESGDLVDIVPKVSLKLGPRWDHAVKTDRPMPVAEAEQDRQFVGTHDRAMLAVEVSVPQPSLSEPPDGSPGRWRRVVWLPFSKYLGLGPGNERTVRLPDGRQIVLRFSRTQHVFPNFAISMVDFKMIAYDHRGAPRDYQSTVRVIPADTSFTEFEHVTQLNAPLTAPFIWNEDRSWPANVLGRLSAALSPGQFKLSQAGWDASGWERTQKLADQGLAPGPRAQFTILGVGNSPGIHIIALGGVLMGLGIPWAFYVKPWLVRREKRRIQEQLARGEYVPPARRSAPSLATGSVSPSGAGS